MSMLAISKSTIASQIVEELRRRIKAEHQMLVSLCRAGQAEKAVSLLRKHILNATAHLTEMARPENGSPS